jgi:hypothetical protein
MLRSSRPLATIAVLSVLTASGAVAGRAYADQVIGGATIEARPKAVALHVDDQNRVTRFVFGAHPVKCKSRRIKAATKGYADLRTTGSGEFSHAQRFVQRRGARMYVHKVSFSGETFDDDPTSWAGGFTHRVTVKRRNGPTLDRCQYKGAWIASA